MTVALLPLDDRPYNLAFVQRLAAVAGFDLLVPPPQAIGTYFTPGSTQDAIAWLRDLPGDVTSAIVAVDMLTCGGLLASRSETIDSNDALARLDQLTQLKRDRPELQLLAFDTILRTSLSARDRESRRVHRLLHRYTTLAGKVEHIEDPAVMEEFQAVRQAIPATVLDRYHAVRRRKHSVNRRAVELVADGVIETLLLLMEDVGPEGELYGVHKAEQHALLRLAHDSAVADRIYLHNGTDEGAMTLLARLVGQQHASSPALFVTYSSADGPGQVPTFEDRTLEENVTSFLAATGSRRAGTRTSADAVLAIHAPYGQPPDLDSFVSGIASDIAAARPVGIVDCTTNTADLNLMRTLGRSIELDRLTAFAAWNTACNSLGTALPQLCIALVAAAGSGTQRLNSALVLERLIDDYVYEGLVRPRLDEALEKQGVNPWDLGPNSDVVRERVAVEMQSEVAVSLAPVTKTSFRFTCTLPWPRTFEPAITVTLDKAAAIA